MRIDFWSAGSSARPSECPAMKPRGQSARGGRACRVSSGSTVTTTVGMPTISIDRCTVTTVR
jgi:hypothetical protein